MNIDLILQKEVKIPRGGARTGAGRKKTSNPIIKKKRNIGLTDGDWQKFKELGGAKWLREMLKKEK